MAATPWQPGLNPVQTGVDLHPCRSLPDCGFYSLVNTSNRPPASACFMSCVLSKNGLPSAWADWYSQDYIVFCSPLQAKSAQRETHHLAAPAPTFFKSASLPFYGFFWIFVSAFC